MSEFFSNEKYKFIFIHIPKTGGTSVKKILSEKIKINDIKFTDELVEYKKSTHIKITKKQFNKYSNYLKFTFVRHPYDWIKSYYNFHYNKDKFYKNLTKKKINKTITINFDEWLNTLTNFNQTDFITDNDTFLVDYICKLENFNEEMKFILKKLNINSEFNNIKMKDSKKFKIDTIKELNNEQKLKIQKICYKYVIMILDY
jgi:hypothetical protein